MSETLSGILSAALTLPDSERRKLRDALDHSLQEYWEIMDDSELDRRVKEIQSGRVQSIPGEELFRQLREQDS